MENLPRYALSALVAGVATAGASLKLASQAENAPRRSPGQTPLEYWLPPTMVVLAPIACCLPVFCLSLCCLLYRSLPNIRSNRDGAEMNNQRGLNRRNRQSIASERALNQVVVSAASSSSNLEASQHSSSSASSSSDTHTNTHTNFEQYGERAQDQVVASQRPSLSASSSSETLTNHGNFVQPTISPGNSYSPSTTLRVNAR